MCIDGTHGEIAENARLRKSEPEIACSVTRADSDDPWQDASVSLFTPLSEAEIENLTRKISSHLPLATDFGSNVPETRRTPMAFVALQEEEVFIPATDEAIEEYRTSHYPEWLESCTDVLRRLHDTLNTKTPWPTVRVRLKNEGSRPAEDALVTFSARGSLQIMPPVYVDESNGEASEEVPTLPRPPSAPRGSWKKKRLGMVIPDIGFARAVLSGHNFDVGTALLRTSPKRDPNRFYYQDRPASPVDTLSLTCSQWRHQSDDEWFDVMVLVDQSPASYSGSLEIEVHASNLTDPLIKNQSIRINVTHTSVFQRADELVDALIETGVKRWG